MSIASEISRLSSVREDIFTSITNKGVTVPATATFSSCPALIDSITGGGGGPATSMINPNFTASGFLSGYRPFTATQIPIPQYDIDNQPIGSGNVILYTYPYLFFGPIPIQVLSANQNQTIYLNFHIDWVEQSYASLMMVQTSSNSRQYEDYKIVLNNIRAIPGNISTSFTPETLSDMWNTMTQQSWKYPGWSAAEYFWFTFGSQMSISNDNNYYEGLTITGYDDPYPTYPSTTTGYITNEISGKESFTGTTNKVPNIYVSGFRNAVYDNSPEGGASVISPSNINLTSFSSNMLKNNIATRGYYTLDSTAYSYSYGSVVSGYSGFEGV